MIMHRNSVWIVAEKFEGGIQAVYHSKRCALVGRMRYVASALQTRRDETLTYGRFGYDRYDYTAPCVEDYVVYLRRVLRL